MNQPSFFAQKTGGLPPPVEPNYADRIILARLSHVSVPIDFHSLAVEAEHILSEVCLGKRAECGWIDFVAKVYTMAQTETGTRRSCLRMLWWAVSNQPPKWRLDEFEKWLAEMEEK